MSTSLNFHFYVLNGDPKELIILFALNSIENRKFLKIDIINLSSKNRTKRLCNFSYNAYTNQDIANYFTKIKYRKRHNNVHQNFTSLCCHPRLLSIHSWIHFRPLQNTHVLPMVDIHQCHTNIEYQ